MVSGHKDDSLTLYCMSSHFENRNPSVRLSLVFALYGSTGTVDCT
jgi:hypothetical protein